MAQNIGGEQGGSKLFAQSVPNNYISHILKADNSKFKNRIEKYTFRNTLK